MEYRDAGVDIDAGGGAGGGGGAPPPPPGKKNSLDWCQASSH